MASNSAKKKKTRPHFNKRISGKKKPKPSIQVSKNGPYVVTGDVPLDQQTILTDREGYAVGYKQGRKYPKRKEYSLCRCGESSSHPYCDGSHLTADFDGTETAGFGKYMKSADRTEGPGLTLTDNEQFCASARFCDRMGGAWNLTRRSDNDRAKKTAVQEATDCPAGRLVAWNKKTEKPIEPKFKPSVSIIEDPAVQASGPIWVKGGIPVESANGKTYEVRNRVTLCRCGASQNKPFCDGTHRPVQFDDGELN